MQRPVNKKRINLIAAAVAVFLCLLPAVSGQELPKKIRGYTVHNADISINNPESKSDYKVEVKFGKPVFSNVFLTGFEVELESEFVVAGKSGSVDFITFEDFEVNGLKVQIEEYKEKFDFSKDTKQTLAKPVKIFVNAVNALKGAASELRTKKKTWRVTGRMFVFGEFKKFGIKFKRVLPVNVDLFVENPIQ